METASAFPPPNKLEEAQAQVNQVVGLMQANVVKVLERDEKLSELDNRATALKESSERFMEETQRLKKKYWWKNMIKKMIMVGGVGFIILIIAIVFFVSGSSVSDSKIFTTTTKSP